MSSMKKNLCYTKIQSYSLTIVPKSIPVVLDLNLKRNIIVNIPKKTIIMTYIKNGQKYGPRWINTVLIHCAVKDYPTKSV